MNENIIICILVLAILVSFYLLMQFKKIRLSAYKWFLKAEHYYLDGEDKMNYVISNFYPLLPLKLRLFINEKMFRELVQKLFDEVHDLLDDGKLNKSNEKGD